MGNYLYDGYQMTNAVYASMETQLPSDITLTYGARYTWVHTDMDMTRIKGSNQITDGSTSDGKLIFNAGLMEGIGRKFVPASKLRTGIPSAYPTGTLC